MLVDCGASHNFINTGRPRSTVEDAATPTYQVEVGGGHPGSRMVS